MNGPADAVIVRDEKKAAHGEDVHTVTRCISRNVLQARGRWSKLGVLGEAGCNPDQRDQKLQSNSADVGDVEVASIMCILLRLEKEKEPEKWKKLHIGRLDGTSCQHLQVMMTKCDTETLGVEGGKESRDETRDGGKTNSCTWPAWNIKDGLR